MKRSNEDMLNGPLLGGIIRYTLPIVLSGILQLLFNAADLMVVGQFCGSVSVGAVSSTGALSNLVVNLFMGISVGAGVCVAHGLGGKREEEVRRTVHTAIPVSILSGLILTVLGIAMCTPMLRLMSTPAEVLPLSALYMKIYFLGITANILYNFCASILRAAGDTKGPLLYLTAAGVINVLLNLLFVIVFDLNVAGVALATTLSQTVSAVLVVRALIRRTDACQLRWREMKIYRPQLVKMIEIGLPAGVQGSMFSISNVIIQSAVNSFGSAFIVAGNGAASNIEGFVYISMNALNQTAVNYIGQNLGARQFDRVKKIFRVCLLSVTVVGLVMGPAAYFAAPWLLRFYIPDSPEAIAYGVLRMGLIALPYFVCGLMDVTTGALRGLGSSFVPMVVTVMGVCVLRVVWVFTIFQVPRYHTPQCLYLSYLVSWALTFGVEFVLFYRVLRKKQQEAQEFMP